MDCSNCINKSFAGTDKCKNFSADKSHSCSNFLTLSSFHQHLVKMTCPEQQDNVAFGLEKQMQEINETGHVQSMDPALEEMAKNWKLR